MKGCRVLILAAPAAALALAGCGGGGSGADPASVAPPGSPLFVEATLQPEGQQKADLDALAKTIAGVDDLGEFIVTELEKSASSSGEELDFEKEVEPWLGEKGGISFQHYDGDNFTGYGVAVQTTDPAAAEGFIDKQMKSSDESSKNGSYEGVEFATQEDGTTIGVLDDFLVVAESEAAFEAMVRAADGESLADRDSYANAVEAAPGGGVAEVFVDIGGLIEGSGGKVDPEAKLFLESAGIEPNDATAVASLDPGSDRVEIDLSTNVTGDNPPSGDASKLLGTLPAGSFAAIAAPDFGQRFAEAIDGIDANGIPGQVPPHKFKSTLKAAGVDLEKLSASIGDLGVFAEGDSKRSLAGAAVLTTKGSAEAANTVSDVGLLLRASHTPGVTAVSGKASGFSVPVPELGPKPLVVVAKGERIAIGYGLAAALRGLSSESGATLAEDPTYREAVAALGDTPISGFANGPAALRLASALVSPGDEKFRKAEPYLRKIDYLALGSGSSDGLATARLIAGIGK